MLHIIRMLERRYPPHRQWFAPSRLLVLLLDLPAGVIVFTAR